jgi:hypothetical protein
LSDYVGLIYIALRNEIRTETNESLYQAKAAVLLVKTSENRSNDKIMESEARDKWNIIETTEQAERKWRRDIHGQLLRGDDEHAVDC